MNGKLKALFPEKDKISMFKLSSELAKHVIKDTNTNFLKTDNEKKKHINWNNLYYTNNIIIL